MSTQNPGRPWWETADSKTKIVRPLRRGVAYYRHSAKDRQENSVAIQQELVQKWAKENGVEIVQEFADRGKSGLTAEGRDGFNDMLDNWVKRRKDFDAVLCLDVSRWGRFQDMDHSATYSAECKKYGKDVIYTTMGLPRPDDQYYSLQVQFERLRAAQHSKELSVKVSHGCIHIARQGFWNGGRPPYGLDRILLDERRNPLQTLQLHQKKGIANQRVTLAPGPEEEVKTVQRIFLELTQARHSLEKIADGLNESGIPAGRGGVWTAGKVRRILCNALYTGTMIYNKTTQKLKTPRRRVPQNEWIKTGQAFAAIVEPPVFEEAQRLLDILAGRYTPEFMLDQLRRIIGEHQILRPAFLRVDPDAPSPGAYAKHFHSLDLAYQRLFRGTLDQVRKQVISLLHNEVDQLDTYDDFVVINRKFTVLIQPSVPVPHGYGYYWYFRPDKRPVVDITLGVPVSGNETPTILGFLALPRLMVSDRSIRLFETSDARLDMYGHTGLDMILQLARC